MMFLPSSGLDDGVLPQQIRNLGLDVSIAWIGSHLHSFVSERTRQQLPTLFFNWTPNILTAFSNFTRLKFPGCSGRNSNRPPTNCDFETHQLSKVMWAKMRTHTPEAHSLISSLSFTHQQYEDLLQLFMKIDFNNADLDQSQVYEEAACQWIKQNKRIWSKWIPKNMTTKQRIYIGGMFPITGPYWRQPGIVPGISSHFVFLGHLELLEC